jgi:hypothetical protein
MFFSIIILYATGTIQAPNVSVLTLYKVSEVKILCFARDEVDRGRESIKLSSK